MMSQRTTSVTLLALSCVVALLSESALARSTTTSLGCIPGYIADGVCDPENDNEDCDYDGGDCCECTCVSTPDNTCGDLDNGGFDCADPNAPCFDDDVSPGFSYDMSVSTDFAQCDGIEAFIRDGDCDSVNNNEECDFDGGDCCECTCGDNLDYECGLFKPFECVDPEAPCVNDDVGASIVGEDSRDFSCEEYPKNC